MAHVRIKLIGAESSRSYFQIDGCGRYDMRDGIAFSIPDGWHTLQAVQVIYDAFSPEEENGEINDAETEENPQEITTEE